jgi:hypothetical protein
MYVWFISVFLLQNFNRSISMTNILSLKEDSKQKLLERPNVVGVGVGYKVTAGEQTDELAVVALVEKKLPPTALTLSERVPVRVSNGVLSVPVDVVEVGRIEALAYKDRVRPAPGGVSIGHYQITAGTLGSLVYDKLNNYPLILSNNHVLANSNDANIGESILQPGPIDGGTLANDVIAELERFVPIDFGEDSGDCPLAEGYARATDFLTGLLGSQHRVRVIKQNQQAVNYVDAAVASPIIADDVTKNILDIGEITETEEYFLGMEVHKTGRTTEYTTGTISAVNATIRVSYGGDKVATFEDQIVSGYMSQGGDSGSLLVSRKNNKAVGLLFAGSNQATIFNPIERVLALLGIRF